MIAIIWGIPKIVDTAKFYDYFVNSLIVSVGAVAVSVSIGCLSGYALARYSGMSGVVILLVALAFRALPRMAFLLPFYWMGRISGLHDTYFLVIIALVAVNQPFTIWLLRSFFMDIPREIEDAAMIDGASRLGAFLKVITPILWPGIFCDGAIHAVARLPRVLVGEDSHAVKVDTALGDGPVCRRRADAGPDSHAGCRGRVQHHPDRADYSVFPEAISEGLVGRGGEGLSQTRGAAADAVREPY